MENMMPWNWHRASRIIDPDDESLYTNWEALLYPCPHRERGSVCYGFSCPNWRWYDPATAINRRGYCGIGGRPE